MKLTDQEINTLNMGRLLRAEADIMLPMLDRRKLLITEKIIMYYRADEDEKLKDRLLRCAAELASADDLISEIKNKIRQAEAIERKSL